MKKIKTKPGRLVVPKKLKITGVDELITESTIYGEGRKRLTRYAQYVLTQRAVPDYRDGLKVVHRRLMWAMKELGAVHSGKHYKSARVTGDTAGKYHPHGDSSIYDALVLMVNNPVSFISSQGNFGSWRDGASAPRYTEVKLSKTATLMLDPDYLNATKDKNMVGTYDNDNIEPLVLPALFPNLLINGNQGIAYGVTSNFPPIHCEDVFNLIRKQIAGEDLNLKRLAKKIRFDWPNGSSCVSADEDVLSWMESGKGSLYFRPEYEIDEDKRTIVFNEVPPNFNWGNVSGKVGDLDFVASIDDMTDKNTVKSATIVVKLKTSVAYEDFEKKAQKIIDMFTNSFSNASNVTIRHTEENIEFKRTTLSSFVRMWTDYRTELEVDMQRYMIKKLNGDIAYQDLLLWVRANSEAVVKTIKGSSNPHPELMAKFDLTSDNADSILRLELSRLSRLSEENIKKKKASLKVEKKQAILHRDNPSPKILTDLNSGLSVIDKIKKESAIERSKLKDN